MTEEQKKKRIEMLKNMHANERSLKIAIKSFAPSMQRKYDESIEALKKQDVSTTSQEEEFSGAKLIKDHYALRNSLLMTKAPRQEEEGTSTLSSEGSARSPFETSSLNPTNRHEHQVKDKFSKMTPLQKSFSLEWKEEKERRKQEKLLKKIRGF